MSKVSEDLSLEKTGDVMELNLGPQHPSTHGVLRIKLRLDGEVVLSAEPVIGYLHTGVEKECESRTYHQVFTLDRPPGLSVRTGRRTRLCRGRRTSDGRRSA